MPCAHTGHIHTFTHFTVWQNRATALSPLSFITLHAARELVHCTASSTDANAMKAITIPPPPSQQHDKLANAENKTIKSESSHGEPSSISQSESPTRPPVSPITPVNSAFPNTANADGQTAISQSGECNANENNSNTRHASTKPQIYPEDSQSISQSHYQQKPPQTQVQQRQHQPGSKAAQPLPVQQTSIPIPAAAPVPAPPTTYIARPPSPVPISTSSNPDAIALRSAISLLQMQRQRGQQDMQTLEQIKLAALKDPEAFVSELVAGKLKSGSGGTATGGGEARSGNAVDDILSASLRGFDDPHERQQDEISPSKSINNGNGNGNGNVAEPTSSNETRNSDPNNQQKSSNSKFATVPTPQNIFRCPPINWAKYHVVGEALDRIHAEQIARPPTGDVVAGPGEVGGNGGAQARNPAYVLSAPYSPFQNKVGAEAGMKRSGKGT